MAATSREENHANRETYLLLRGRRIARASSAQTAGAVAGLNEYLIDFNNCFGSS
jgi:hypothetical protein